MNSMNFVHAECMININDTV